MKREALAAAAQLEALRWQHSSLLTSLEAQDAELADDLERLKAELVAALVGPVPCAICAAPSGSLHCAALCFLLRSRYC